ncbi:MAG: PQQ-dependent sugar dehydrogenase [Myxococcota bacterium]
MITPRTSRALLGLLVLACASCGSEDVASGDGDTVTAPSAGSDGNVTDAQNINSPTGDGTTPAPDVAPEPSGPHPFVYTTACQLPPEPPSTSDVTLVNAFPVLLPGMINYPLLLTHAGDDSGRLFVVERFGRIKVFQNNVATTTTTTFLDLSSAIATNSEGGLLGLAFHPKYAENGHFFVHYTELDNSGTMHSIISRFTVSASDPNQANPTSEVRFLDIVQPYYNHDGGMIAFGPDDRLYVGMGDGGAGGDPLGHGQNTYTMLGAMLRIDVDTPEDGKNYGIPEDNPFVGGGGLPEIWAWGLRNPWRFSFDTLTGALWAGDVGQNAWEEISVVEGGKNYGWATMEGFECFPANVTNCDSTGMAPPVMVYPNAGKGSVTGGYVYRGSAAPSLYGTYIFADYEQDSLYLLPTDGSPPDGPAMETPDSVAGFGQDAEGEVYLLGLLTGTIYRFEPADAPTPQLPETSFPQTLSATGCFASLRTMTPVSGVVPYELNHPFWSDGAEKSRWMVLPDGGQITFSPAGEWEVPLGTLFIKHFEIDTVEDGVMTRTKLETRFLVQEDNGVRGYTYRWDDDGSDATLLQSGATRTLTVPDEVSGEVTFQWQYPARHQCKACHTPEAGSMLGTETAQLNRVVDLHGVTENQIVTWANWGLFTGASSPADLSGLAAHPALDDETQSVESRARSWLHVNCASCHMGEASGAEMDLRVGTDLAEMAVCNETPGKGDLGVTDAVLLAPGSPQSSILYRRAAGEPPARMPPVASARHDAQGVSLLEAWIAGLSACP